LIEIYDAQVMIVEMKEKALFKNETASSSMFLSREELVEEPLLLVRIDAWHPSLRKIGKTPAHVRFEIVQSNLSVITFSRTSLLSTPESSNQPPK
jgi:hypothetical protein